MCKEKMENMGLFITIFSFIKNMEGIINPGDLSCQAGCDSRKPATTINGSESASKLRTGPECHAHFNMVTSCIHWNIWVFMTEVYVSGELPGGKLR